MFSAYARNVLANLPKAYSNDRRSHCVRAKKFIAYARSQPEAGHGNGMPVRRLWPEKSPARAWLHLRQLHHARRRGKGAVMSLVGTYWRTQRSRLKFIDHSPRRSQPGRLPRVFAEGASEECGRVRRRRVAAARSKCLRAPGPQAPNARETSE